MYDIKYATKKFLYNYVLQNGTLPQSRKERGHTGYLEVQNNDFCLTIRIGSLNPEYSMAYLSITDLNNNNDEWNSEYLRRNHASVGSCQDYNSLLEKAFKSFFPNRELPTDE